MPNGKYQKSGLIEMPSPHPAVTPAAIEIAKKYGKNVSKGIVEMGHVIEVLDTANKEKAQEIKKYSEFVRDRV